VNNPARLKDHLDVLLGNDPDESEHYRALHYDAVSAFVTALTEREGVALLALSEPALAIIEEMAKIRQGGELVFPGGKPDKRLSETPCRLF
jgi:hypothetical protein